MVHKRTLELSDRERDALMAHRDHDGRPQVRERCAALLKIAAGQSAYDVARHGLLKPRDPDTVYGWLSRYEQDGLHGLLSRLQGGNRRPFRGADGGSG
jgi:Helix-turn-helix domain